MMSPTGSSKPIRISRKNRCTKGFTFIEIMIAAAILATGILFIYKTFFTSLSYLDHFVNRIYANTLIQNEIVHSQQDLEIKKDLSSIEKTRTENVKIGNKGVDFTFHTVFSPLEDVGGIFLLNVDLSWKERERNIRLSRQAFVAVITPETKQ